MKVLSYAELSPASSKETFQALCKSPEDWFVRSKADVEQLAATPHSPWKNVPKEAIHQFIEKLEFKNGGLAHSNYSSLEAHMSFKEFMNMWAHFGINRELFLMDADKKCDSPGTCSYCNGCSCTSNC